MRRRRASEDVFSTRDFNVQGERTNERADEVSWLKEEPSFLYTTIKTEREEACKEARGGDSVHGAIKRCPPSKASKVRSSWKWLHKMSWRWPWLFLSPYECMEHWPRSSCTWSIRGLSWQETESMLDYVHDALVLPCFLLQFSQDDKKLLMTFSLVLDGINFEGILKKENTVKILHLVTFTTNKNQFLLSERRT